jgi:purine-binding chemotaxis protein CheW
MENKVETKFIIFKIGREFYAINLDYVERILHDEIIRAVPNTSEEIKGIIHNDENIVPVIDLRVKFAIQSDKINDVPFIIICKIKEHNLVAGLIVDEVIEVKDIPDQKDLGNINGNLTGNSTAYIQSVYRADKQNKNENLIIILNINKLLGTESLEEIEKIKDDNHLTN